MTNWQTEFAPAKVNLALHVTGRRADGYHLLDSLVVFAQVGDTIAARPSAALSLALEGPFAKGLSIDEGNLVLRAARLARAEAELRLIKNLPIASGIGGGSADAAATLRLLSRITGRSLPEDDAVLALGADVPVCLLSRSCRMSGIGERIEPVELPEFWLVLVNPGVPVPTGAVFGGLSSRDNPPLNPLAGIAKIDGLVEYLARARNDLEAPARRTQPVIEVVLNALKSQFGCRIARMSGSGATCFGVFCLAADAEAAATSIRHAAPAWWVAATAVV